MIDDMEVDTPAPSKSENTESSKNSASNPSNSNFPQLDLVFIIDCTGSMQSYINKAKQSIRDVVAKIIQTQKKSLSLQLGLVAYRDHPPQDMSFVTKNFNFTDSVEIFENYLKTLSANGGGDGPEAVTPALYDSLNLDWRTNATKIVIIIADAPPHGLGDAGDGFPNGDPSGHDPISLAHQMASKGIVIYSVSCEPAISRYKFAVDFFKSISKITGGIFVPLTSADSLPDVIVGGANEMMDLEKMFTEIKLETKEFLKDKDKNEAEFTNKLLEKFSGRKAFSLTVQDIYKKSENSIKNVELMSNSKSIPNVSSLNIVSDRLRKESTSSSPIVVDLSKPSFTKEVRKNTSPYKSHTKKNTEFKIEVINNFPQVSIRREDITVDQVERLVAWSKTRLDCLKINDDEQDDNKIKKFNKDEQKEGGIK
ncbi:hypothetical protein HK099_005024, partial [Clydaea vesicula]